MKKRVLLLEDNEMDHHPVQWAIRNEGLASTTQLVHVSSLAEAEAELDGDGIFNLALIDLNVPDSSGLETLDAIQKVAPSETAIMGKIRKYRVWKPLSWGLRIISLKLKLFPHR